MTTVLVQFVAPEAAAIEPGKYEVFERGQRIKVEYPQVLVYRGKDTEERLFCEGRPVFSSTYESDLRFDGTEMPEELQLENQCRRYEEMTLRAVNRLLQWYRFYTGRYFIRELVFSQISPGLITFLNGGKELTYRRDYSNEEPREWMEFTDESRAQFRADLQKRHGPPIEELLLLDAKAALSEHHYKRLYWN